MKNFSKSRFKNGGVSMFMVIITMVLITIITASFLRLMVRDGNQASTQDLSQSAYDSAQAGVEDAKRFIDIYNRECTANPSSADCARYKQVFGDNTCHAVGRHSGIGQTSGETQIQINAGDTNLNQAYTCLRLNNKTSDFLTKIEEDDFKIIPLKSAGAFNKIKISWHNSEDAQGKTMSLAPTFSSLPKKVDYNSGNPAVVRAMVFGYDRNSFNVEGFNSSFAGDRIGLNQRIYYPTSKTVDIEDNLPANRSTALDKNNDHSTEVQTARCVSDASSAYACSVTINLGDEASPAETKEAYLKLSTIYSGANFKIELFSGDNLVNFLDAQIAVDSTGRANDQFRRVQSRVEIGGNSSILPGYAMYSEGNGGICKEYSVTLNKIKGC